ncbi:hypothetical protein QUF74_11595 [Candidatus Halobeggiatoa sp. HSG11]|nr:hypothetical protein [Candidatus Halobeggiatoa sp. HSG11]
MEKISWTGTIRVVCVSESWLQTYVNEKYDSTPKVIDVTGKGKI